MPPRDQPDWADILKRRRAARDYFADVPPSRVNLELFSRGLRPTGHDQPCGAVGCVYGHLETMPEMAEWPTVINFLYAGGPNEGDRVAIVQFFADPFIDAPCPCGRHPSRMHLFANRKQPCRSEHAEGVARLEALVAEAEAKVRTSGRGRRRRTAALLVALGTQGGRG